MKLVIQTLLKAGKRNILLCTAALVGLVTWADYLSGHDVSLAALYILPMMLCAVVLRPVETALVAIFCSYLRFLFDVPGNTVDVVLRFVFAAVAYFVSGLFVSGLVKNREQAVRHLGQIQVEQKLRREIEEQLSLLAESSPAAIFTLDERGAVLAANRAANTLFLLPEGQNLKGRSVQNYLPMLTEALRLDAGRLRTSAQCQGHRENGEIFLAHIWFSSYLAPEGKRLAAIVVDSSEEMRDREEQGLKQLMVGNRIATAAIAHEVRNFCEAMAMLCEDLRRRHNLSKDEGLRGLDNLVGGLEAIASFELQSKSHETIESVPLREVLDNLRIVVEPDWREIEGALRWHLPDQLPSVWAEPHGLLQAFLNLSQNSLRAVLECKERALDISVASRGQKLIVKFQDSGPGVQAPEKLFQPFQEGATGTGLGLYVSRFVVRSYGGELRFEPQPSGSCFAVELDIV